MDIKVLKPEVKRLYVEGKPVPEICDMFKINDSTVYQWARKENWKTLRDEKMKMFISSPEILMQTLENTIQEIPKHIKDPKSISQLTDSIVKIVKSIKTISKDKDRLSSIIFVIGELGKHMNENEKNYLYDDEFRNKFDKLMSGFQEKMLLKYSSKNFG